MAKRKHKHHVFPIVILALLLALIVALYTFLTAAPKNLQFGVLSLDEGYVPAGQTQESNFGDQMLKSLTSGDIIDTMGGSKDLNVNNYTIEFKTYETEEQLNEAIQSEEVAGAIVVPEDYTKNKITETTENITKGVTDTTSQAVNVIVEKTTDPSVTEQLGSTMTNLLSAAGIDATTTFAQAEADGANDPAYNLDPDPFQHIWLLLPPIVASTLLGWGFSAKKGATLGYRLRRYGIGILLSLLISALLTIADYSILSLGYGYEANTPASCAHLWLMNFLVMLFFGGLAQLSPWLSAIAGGVLLAFGGLANLLPIESYPEFLRPWIIPTFTDASLNSVSESFFPGAKLWTLGEQALLAYAIIGVIVGLAVAALSRGATTKD